MALTLAHAVERALDIDALVATQIDDARFERVRDALASKMNEFVFQLNISDGADSLAAAVKDLQSALHVVGGLLTRGRSCGDEKTLEDGRYIALLVRIIGLLCDAAIRSCRTLSAMRSDCVGSACACSELLCSPEWMSVFACLMPFDASDAELSSEALDNVLLVREGIASALRSVAAPVTVPPGTSWPTAELDCRLRILSFVAHCIYGREDRMNSLKLLIEDMMRSALDYSSSHFVARRNAAALSAVLRLNDLAAPLCKSATITAADIVSLSSFLQLGQTTNTGSVRALIQVGTEISRDIPSGTHMGTSARQVQSLCLGQALHWVQTTIGTKNTVHTAQQKPVISWLQPNSLLKKQAYRIDDSDVVDVMVRLCDAYAQDRFFSGDAQELSNLLLDVCRRNLVSLFNEVSLVRACVRLLICQNMDVQWVFDDLGANSRSIIAFNAALTVVLSSAADPGHMLISPTTKLLCDKLAREVLQTSRTFAHSVDESRFQVQLNDRKTESLLASAIRYAARNLSTHINDLLDLGEHVLEQVHSNPSSCLAAVWSELLAAVVALADPRAKHLQRRFVGVLALSHSSSASELLDLQAFVTSDVLQQTYLIFRSAPLFQHLTHLCLLLQEIPWRDFLQATALPHAISATDDMAADEILASCFAVLRKTIRALSKHADVERGRSLMLELFESVSQGLQHTNHVAAICLSLLERIDPVQGFSQTRVHVRRDVTLLLAELLVHVDATDIDDYILSRIRVLCDQWLVRGQDDDWESRRACVKLLYCEMRKLIHDGGSLEPKVLPLLGQIVYCAEHDPSKAVRAYCCDTLEYLSQQISSSDSHVSFEGCSELIASVDIAEIRSTLAPPDLATDDSQLRLEGATTECY